MQKTITLVQITDTHLGQTSGPIRAGYPDSDRQLEAVIRDINEFCPDSDAILVTGDLAEDPQPEVYARLLEHLSRLPTPISALAGNHDHHDHARQAFLEAGHGFDDERILGNWLIIGLDSSWPGHVAGLIRDEDLRRIDDTIARYPDHWVLVAVHHPVVAVGSRWLDRLGLSNGDELLTHLAQYPGVRACIFGHIHQAFDQTHGSIRLLGCPSTLVQFLPGAEDFALELIESGYRVLRLHASGEIETEVRRVSGTRPVALPE